MWKILYQLAVPHKFYQISGYCIPSLKAMSLVLLSVAWIWALFLVSPDYQQGDAFRIMYVHVPSAFLSMLLYLWMGFLALLLIIWRIKLAGMLLGIVAQTGACMTLLALISGSIWGKPMWGTWWIWDARLTSELILLFLYGAIIASSYAYQNKSQGDRVIAILTLVGLLDLPIIHYSVKWWNTLHQGSSLSILYKPKIAASSVFLKL